MNRTEFERVTPEEVGLSSKAIERFVDQLESGFTEMHGLMIMRHGKICTEGWWAPYAPGLRHGLQSLSKTYAATAVGIAYTEGLLKLEDRVIDIFPDEAPANPSENLQKLTVRDVLCMGCGMDTMPRPSKEWIRDFLAIPVNHVPGTTYMYNSTGSTLLGAIVRKLTGQGLQEYLTPRLFDKIGIRAENLRWMKMPDGMEVGGGGLFATTEDNLRLMKLYADGGVWNGERILAADYVAKATSLQNESASEAKGNPEAKDNFVGYGFQMWMCQPAGVYRADGAMGQFSIVVPDKDMIISINETATGAHWAQKTLDTVWEFLDDLGTPGQVLPADTTTCSRLARRMQHLSLAAPVFAPSSPLVSDVSGVTFEVTGGRLSFENTIVQMMSGGAISTGIRQFGFTFDTDACLLRFVQDGTTYTAAIALDGTRRLNIVKIGEAPVDKLCLSGYWSAPETFTVLVRWVETCFEKKFDFTFVGSEVAIAEEETVGGFGIPGFLKEEPITAKRAE